MTGKSMSVDISNELNDMYNCFTHHFGIIKKTRVADFMHQDLINNRIVSASENIDEMTKEEIEEHVLRAKKALTFPVHPFAQNNPVPFTMPPFRNLSEDEIMYRENNNPADVHVSGEHNNSETQIVSEEHTISEETQGERRT